jgi:RHS repeat-associated protein
MKKVLYFISTALVSGMAYTGIAQAETILSVTQYSYDQNFRPDCTVTRMNPAVFGSLPASACTLGVAGTDGPDRISKKVYDAASQLTQIRQGVGTSAERVYSTFAYSVNGKVTDSIDANGNRTKMTYDGFDRLVSLSYPSTTRPSAFNASTQATALSTSGAHSTTDYETYVYDANGNRTEWRRRSGELIKSDFDNLNRETRQYNPNGLIQELHTGYDLSGKVVYKRFGSASGSGVIYAYDGLGRVTSTTDINGRTVSYQYNQASARTRLTHPDGNWQPYTLDALDRVTWTGMGAANLTIGYNSLGQVTSLIRGNATSTSVNYDGIGRVQSYGHDLAGTSYDASWAFGYNPASQIRTLNAAAAIYDYREGQSNTNPRTYDGLNRDAGIAGIGGYDNQGNLTNDGTRVMTYDLYNRLKTVIGNGANLTLTYDTEGRLSSYTNNGAVTQFLYDGVNLIAEYNGSGQVIKRYVHGTGTDQPFVQFNGSDPNNASLVRYLYTNYQGSVIATADSNGYKSEIYKYGAYGEPKNGFNQTSFSGESRFRYTGQTILPDAQLYYYKARVYDPIMGRFMQTDPIGSDDDLNIYAYVGGDPINATDPTGTEAGSVSYGGIRSIQAERDEKGYSREEAYGSVAVAGAVGCVLAPSACAKAAQSALLGAVVGYGVAKVVDGKSDKEALVEARKGAVSGAVTGGAGKVYGSAKTLSERAVKGAVLGAAAHVTEKAQGGSDVDAGAAAAGTFLGEVVTGSDVGATLGGTLFKKAVSTGTKEGVKRSCKAANQNEKC